MKSIILSAGQGTRLAPITNDIPKCLIIFDGLKLIEYQLIVYKNAGISDISIVGGYHHEKLSGLTNNLFINTRFNETNMVNSLFCARELFTGTNDIIISYGDIVYEPRVIDQIIRTDGDIVVVVDTNWYEYWSIRMENPINDVETLVLDNKNNRIVEIGKKTTDITRIHAQYIGLIKISTNIFDVLLMTYDNMDRSLVLDGQNFDNMYMTSLINHLIKLEFDVVAAPIYNGWLEFDTLSDLEIYTSLLDRGVLTKFFNPTFIKHLR